MVRPLVLKVPASRPSSDVIDFDKMVLAPLDKVFGQVVNYQSASAGEAFPLQGIFTDGFKAPSFDADGSTKWNTSAPTLGVRAADFSAAPAKNDKVTISGKLYLVTDSRPDGVGWIVLVLKAM